MISANTQLQLPYRMHMAFEGERGAVTNHRMRIARKPAVDLLASVTETISSRGWGCHSVSFDRGAGNAKLKVDTFKRY